MKLTNSHSVLLYCLLMAGGNNLIGLSLVRDLCDCGNPISFSKFFIHTTSEVASTIVLNSASIEDQTMISCFFVYQATRF